MAVAFDLDLTDDEKKQLAAIIQCDPGQLEIEFAPYAAAAALEYARMFLGQRVFTRGSDLLEYRLYLLVRNAFGDRIPDEQHVCNLFQTTRIESRSLIRSVMSKYQYELTDARGASLVDAIKSVTLVNKELLLELKSGSTNIVEALNQAIASINGLLPQIQRRRGTVSAYVIQPNSYRKLCEQYNVKPAAGTPDA